MLLCQLEPPVKTDPMFVLSKLAWWLLSPGTLFLLALCLAALLLRTRWRHISRRLVVTLALIGLFVAVVPIGQWLTVPLENRFPPMIEPPARVDGIVVLGGSVRQRIAAARGQVALSGTAERLFTAVALARRYPGARLVFTGGSGDPFRQELKEAPVARAVFTQLGLGLDIAAGRVTFEDQSRNTYENAVFTQRMVKPRPGEIWLLVTSARHMPRAMGCFNRVGWSVRPYPVDYNTTGRYTFTPRFDFAGGLRDMAGAVKAWVGLFYYYLAGYSSSLFPGPTLPGSS